MDYQDCVALGDFGCERVVSWLRARGRVFDGRVVRTDKGRLSVMLQRSAGDILFNSDRRTVLSIEVKTEAKQSANLFLETYSNADGQTPRRGWLHTLDADWLFYYFADIDLLCIVDFQRLKRWATPETLARFDEREQKKTTQHNRTVGRLVPILILEREVGLVIRTRISACAEVPLAQ